MRTRVIRAIFAATSMVALLSPGTAQAELAQTPSLPSTAVGQLTDELLKAINSNSAHEIDAFVARRFLPGIRENDSWPTPCCDERQISAMLVNIAHRSGGVTLDEVHPNGGDIVVFVDTRVKHIHIYVAIHTEASDPSHIKNLQIVPDLHPVSGLLTPLPAGTPFDQRLAAAKRALVESGRQNFFSGVLIAERGDKLLLQGAYGEADNIAHRKVASNTRFNLASTGKLFTAVAVAQLVSSGKLNYDAPISRYLPDYPNKQVASKITLRQLLTHSSGLADIFAEPPPKSPLLKLSDYYPLFANKPLLFEPGKGRSYSNTGFLVASMVVERVSGEDFRDYLRNHIFGPAGMTRTGWQHRASVAVPYTLGNVEDPLAPNRPWVSAAPFYANLLGGPAAGPGGEFSTAGDLIRFIQALRDGRILDPAARLKMIREGLGCMCSAEGDHLTFGHTGGGPGVDTGLEWDLRTDFIMAFVSNYDPPFAQSLASSLSEELRKP